jgi:hypothetical protein
MVSVPDHGQGVNALSQIEMMKREPMTKMVTMATIRSCQNDLGEAFHITLSAEDSEINTPEADHNKSTPLKAPIVPRAFKV